MEAQPVGRQRDTFWWPPFAMTLGWALLSLPAIYWITYLDQRDQPPACFGLGWGCTLDPGSTVAFYAILIALPTLLVSIVVIVGLGVVGPQTRPARLWAAGAALPLLFIVTFVVP